MLRYIYYVFSTTFQGVTFLAFGNGAPDIFSSIASVLSAPKPRAELALGSLLGAVLLLFTKSLTIS